MSKEQGRKQWIAAFSLFLAAVALLAASRKIPGFSEWYGQSVYPVIVTVIGRVMGWFPFSVVEMGIYGAVIWTVWTLVRRIREPKILVRKYSMFLAMILFLYASCCGVNYYRTPFSYYYMKQRAETGNMNMQMKRESSEEILKELCIWLTERVNEARMELEKEEGMYELFLLELTTGLRRGELLALTWNDLNFKTGELHINKQFTPAGGKIILCEPKTKAAFRTIVLPPPMVELLKEYKKGIFSPLM